jgi:hypothetical protein
MVLLTTEAYRSQLVWEVEYQSRGVNAVLAHEIAHQWFGHKAMPASGSQKWMAESMAEYAAGLAMAALNPDERQSKGWKAMYAEWKGNVKECGGVALDAAAFLGGADGGAMNGASSTTRARSSCTCSAPPSATRPSGR